MVYGFVNIYFATNVAQYFEIKALFYYFCRMIGKKIYVQALRWLGLLLCICLLVCFAYGMHKSYLSMLPQEVPIRYADLDALPRGLTSIEKLLHDRLPADTVEVKDLVVYHYQGHTLYDMIKGADSLTIPALITDTLPPVFEPVPAIKTEWHDSLLSGTLPLDKYELDYRRIIARYDGQVSRIEWNSFDSIPLYIISLEGHDEPIYINASTPFVKPFYLTAEEASDAVKAFCQPDSVGTELLTQYDDYYIDLYQELTLPVWKTIADNHTFYINPRTGSYQSFNSASKWLYVRNHVFQVLRYKLFSKYPERWQPVMWVLLILGTLLSLTGVLTLTRKLMNYKTN